MKNEPSMNARQTQEELELNTYDYEAYRFKTFTP